MTFNHAVVWIDHREAHIIHFNAEESSVATVKTHGGESHIHHHGGTVGSGKAAIPQSYLHEVVETLASAKEVLVVGPGSAKLDLIKHVHKHDPRFADKIVGVETVDHPSDGQLLAYARKYFVPIDRMRGLDLKL